jgi:hypothetical protein
MLKYIVHWTVVHSIIEGEMAMTRKKLVAFISSIGILAASFFIFSPNIPMPIETQKQVMSVLYSDEGYAESAARNTFGIMQDSGGWGFKSQEDLVAWLKKTTWSTDGSRELTIEPILTSDFGWPETISSLKVTLTYKRDGSRSIHHYRYLGPGKLPALSPRFEKIGC